MLALLLGYSLLHGLGMTLFRGQNYLPVAPFSSLAAAWAMVEAYRLAARWLPLLGRPGSRLAVGAAAGLLLLAHQGAVVYARAVPTNWVAAEERLRRELSPLDLRQLALERAPRSFQLGGGDTRILSWEVDRLDRLPPGQLDRMDLEVFPRSRLDGVGGTFYRARRDRLTAPGHPAGARAEMAEGRFLRSQGREWVLLFHPWSASAPPERLALTADARPRRIGALLPAGLRPGEVVSVLLWVPRGERPRGDVLQLGPGGRTIPLFPAGRQRQRSFLVSPRFTLEAGEDRIGFVASRPPESLQPFGMELHRWRPGGAVQAKGGP